MSDILDEVEKMLRKETWNELEGKATQELRKKLAQWLNDQKQSHSTNIALLSVMLSCVIGVSGESHLHICATGTVVGDFIHQRAHMIYAEASGEADTKH